MKSPSLSDVRRRELAQIHIAIKQLGMDDAGYRDVLFAVARVRSSKDLDWTGRKRVLDHLVKCGAKVGRGGFKGAPKKPKPANAALIGKIEAQLADMKLAWEYAHAIARQMFGIAKLEWCDAKQLRAVVTALAQRQAKLGWIETVAEQVRRFGLAEDAGVQIAKELFGVATLGDCRIDQLKRITSTLIARQTDRGQA